MSRKGGYKIIDLKGLDFSEDMVIKGIHESIEDNYGKPLLFSGIVIDGVEKEDVFANAVVNGDGYDVTLYGQTLHISNIDVVSLLNTIVYDLENQASEITLTNGFYEFQMAKSFNSNLNIFTKNTIVMGNFNTQDVEIKDVELRNINGDDAFSYISLNYVGQGDVYFYALVQNGIAFIYTI